MVVNDIERGGVRYQFVEAPPPANDFVDLRAAEGWGKLEPAVAERALARSCFALTVYAGEEAVGFGRLVGDEEVYFFLTDILVRRDHRGIGLGAMIVQRLLDMALKLGGGKGSIALMSARGKEQFYERFGFMVRPNANFGAGMSWAPPSE